MTVTTAGWIALAIYFIPYPFVFVGGVRWSLRDTPEENYPDFLHGLAGISVCFFWPFLLFVWFLSRVVKVVK